jgi:hypothetical protein
LASGTQAAQQDAVRAEAAAAMVRLEHCEQLSRFDVGIAQGKNLGQLPGGDHAAVG